jgi:lactoylglutathione lyase
VKKLINKIAHLAFHVNDMEASLKFYGTFGIKKVFSINNGNGEPWIEYLKVADGQFIELFYAREKFEPQPTWKNKYYAHLCLSVDDIDETAKAIVDAGYELVAPAKKGGDGNWQCWAHDPDGNAIEFMQMMPGSLQSQYG